MHINIKEGIFDYVNNKQVRHTMKLNDKQFQLEIKNNHLGEYCVPFVSDDYKSCVRKANWYRNKVNLGWGVGYTKEDVKDIRVFDRVNNTYTQV